MSANLIRLAEPERTNLGQSAGLGLQEVLVRRNVSRSSAPYQGPEPGCSSSYELVMIGLTFPLWTFIVMFTILMLIHYLRSLQRFHVYDKCTWRNAHFRYDFHMVIGRHSSNYSRHEAYAILDLLDGQLVSTLTIQIPGTTMFNDQQIFLYRHSRDNLRCINFTLYRRHPIKDIKSIRIAHTCNAPESRLFIYGLELRDCSNNENRFFPIQSVVKYRGTQWALVTTFEPKAELDFTKLGVDCFDPFRYSAWPTYVEVLTILLYIWCAAFCFGHLMSVKELFDSTLLHSLTIFFITASSAATISFLYLRLIKPHTSGFSYESLWGSASHTLFLLTIITISAGLWAMALSESKRCYAESADWLISTSSCSASLTLIILFCWFVARCRRKLSSRRLLMETEAQLAKTNSRENLQFVNDPKPSWCHSIFARQQNLNAAHNSGREGPPKNWKALGPPLNSDKTKTLTPPSRKAKTTGQGAQEKQHQQQTETKQTQASPHRDQEETLDTAFGVGSKYMKARNRNSISQYV